MIIRSDLPDEKYHEFFKKKIRLIPVLECFFRGDWSVLILSITSLKQLSLCENSFNSCSLRLVIFSNRREHENREVFAELFSDIKWKPMPAPPCLQASPLHCKNLP